MSNSINSKTTDIKILIASQWQIKEKHKEMIGSIQDYITSVRKDIGINKDEFICKMKSLKTFTTNLDTTNNKICKSILKIVNDEIIKKTSNSPIRKKIIEKTSDNIQKHHIAAEAILLKSKNSTISHQSIKLIDGKIDEVISKLGYDNNEILSTLKNLKDISIKNKDVKEKIHTILDGKINEINKIENTKLLNKTVNHQESNKTSPSKVGCDYPKTQLEMPSLIDVLKFPEKTKDYFFQKLNDSKINKGTVQYIKNYIVNQESKIGKNTFASMLYNLASQEIDSMQTLADEEIVKWVNDSFDQKTNKLEQGSMPDLIGNNGNKSQESTVAKYKLPPVAAKQPTVGNTDTRVLSKTNAVVQPAINTTPAVARQLPPIQNLKPVVSAAVIEGGTQQVAPIEPEQVSREAKKPNLFNRMKNSVQGFFSRMVSGLRNIFRAPVAR